MSEAGKTVAFVVAAALALGAAWMGQPRQVGVAVPDQVGLPLFPEFTDPYDAKSMEIVEYDPEVGEISTFEVAQKQGLWVIPSHRNYPADAEENLKAAATLLIDLKVINQVSSDSRKDHSEYGVVLPDPEKTRLGDAGIGKLVTFKDDKGSRLAEIVIGQEVQGQPELRYVRKGDADPVYVVKIDPTKMSTRFENWVERDVLNLNGLDIKRLSIRDYSVSPELTSRGLQLAEEPRLELDVVWDEIENSWRLETLKEFRNGQMQKTPLLDNEELDKESLDGMKTALDDLVIVDVEKKPASLASGSTDITRDRDALQSLLEHGFYPFQDRDGKLDLRSSDGEVIVDTKDAIEISLKFGGINADSESAAGKLNRFVMISAAVKQDAIEKPRLDLTGLEDDGAGPEVGTEAAESTAPADDSNAAAAGAATADAADVSSDGDTDQPAEDVDALKVDDSAADPGMDADEAEANGDAQADAAAEEVDETAAPDSEVDDSPNADGATEPSVSETADAQTEKNEERTRRLKEYDRLMDQYKEKVQAANKKVDELNYRFSEWYYIVAEDEYNKIHLHRANVVKEKESAAETGADIDAFRQLQEQGLEQPEE